MRKIAVIALAVISAACAAATLSACKKRHEHDYGETETYIQATCKQVGMDFRTCKSCNEVQWIPTAKTEHDYQPVRKGATKNAHFSVCNICGDEKTEEHDFNEYGACKACGYTGSEGLKLEFDPISGSYKVTGIGAATETDLVIPAFYGTFPVTEIAAEAFLGCNELTSVTIPDSIKAVGKHAFLHCTALKGVYISDLAAWCGIEFGDGGIIVAAATSNPLSVAKKLYLNGELVEELTVPDGVEKIGQYAFTGCAVKKVTLPASLKEIGKCAFALCDSLESVTVKKELQGNGLQENSLQTIGDRAFTSCSALQRFTVDKGVTSIGTGAFTSCGALNYVYFADRENWYYDGTPFTVFDLGDPAEAAKLLASVKTDRPWGKKAN